MANENEEMVVMNCGTQGMNKFRMGANKVVLEKKTFPPNVPIRCSREMGEALLKKYSNPNMAIFFRNPNIPQHKIEIQNRAFTNFSPDIKRIIEDNDSEPQAKSKVIKRKYTRRK